MSHSTGALSPEQHQAQDERYAQNHVYDYVIIGTGMGGLTMGSLLANAGKKVCLLEAHDRPGGYGHTFTMGDFSFCAELHYIFGCGEDGVIYQFLKRCGLEKDITFELYDADGYDHMAMPDGKRVKIPYDWDELISNIEQAYPGQREQVKQFVNLLRKIRQEVSSLPHHKIRWWEYLTIGWKYLTLYRYQHKTLQQVYDEFGLSKEVQAVFAANAGDLQSPPEELSIIAYALLMCGYGSGAYYPSKHYEYYVERLATFIQEHEGCHIYYETPVTKIEVENGKVTQLIAGKDNKTFTAETIICNADPQNTAKNIIGWEKIPANYRSQLTYEYSPSCVTLYLGLKDIDLRDHGFGNFNIWHCEQWDMNQAWKEQLEGNFDKPWLFISTPSLHSDEPGGAPEGHQILEIVTLANYQHFKDLKADDKKRYREEKMAIADRMLDIMEEKYVPNLRDHIALKIVGSPTTNEDYVKAPFGTAYGIKMSPQQMGLNRIKCESPWPNFFWCNATSGFASVYGTTNGAVELYKKLTGDHYDKASK